MTNRVIQRAFQMLTLAVGMLVQFGLASAETLVGTNVDNRVIVGFKVDPGAMGHWVPDGWIAVPFPNGPLKGGNLLLVLIDRQLQLDAEGKPTTPANSRYAVFAGLGKEASGDDVRLYVYRILASDPVPNPYGNSIGADVARKESSEGPANGTRARTEVWAIDAIDGNQIDLSLDFTSGKRSWGPAGANPFSNTNIGFSRIYRYSQLVDLVMSKELGKPLQGSLQFKAEGPDLSKLFDGSELVVAIMDIPVYTRQVFLP